MAESTIHIPRNQEQVQLPSFDAVIPAYVRYDSNLSNNAKLLYGELRALTNAYGFCWATNEGLKGFVYHLRKLLKKKWTKMSKILDKNVQKKWTKMSTGIIQVILIIIYISARVRA